MALTDKLTAIGNAIREKTGEADLIPLADMPGEVNAVYKKGRMSILVDDPEAEEPWAYFGKNSMEKDNGYRLSVIQYSDTEGNKDFERIFQDCAQLTDEDVPNLDTRSGETFGHYFNGCTALTKGPLIDVSNGKNLRYLYANCPNITEIPEIDTSNGETFAGMFYNCSGITTIPLIDTSKGTSFNDMFSGCENLATVPKFNMNRAESCYTMFYGCKKLQTIPALSFISCKTFTAMFSNCWALQSFSNVTTSRGTDFSMMFDWCVVLSNVKINVSGATKEGSLTNMFANCGSLTHLTFEGKIYVSLDLHWSNILGMYINGIINALADYSTGANNLKHTITFSPNNKANLTDTQRENIAKKGWILG